MHLDCPDDSLCTAFTDAAALAAGALNYCDGEALSAALSAPLDAEGLAQAKAKQAAGEDLSVEEQALLHAKAIRQHFDATDSASTPGVVTGAGSGTNIFRLIQIHSLA